MNTYFREVENFITNEIEPRFENDSQVSTTFLHGYFNEEVRTEQRVLEEEGLYGAGTGMVVSELAKVKHVTDVVVFQLSEKRDCFLNYVEIEIWNKKKDAYLEPEDLY